MTGPPLELGVAPDAAMAAPDVVMAAPAAPRDASAKQRWASAPTELVGHGVLLRPLQAADLPVLVALTRLEDFAHYLTWPKAWTPEGFGAWILPALGRNWPLAVIDAVTSELVGCSSLMDIDPAHRSLEIGRTWYRSAARGTRVNPGCKLLLLDHAFEALGAQRVTLKCDARNAHSTRAIEKLGARPEGVLRRNRVRQDGYFRDTAMFSITRADWPGVRDGLLRRLGEAGPDPG